jgi:osmotically inducible protein OsmC
MSVLYSTKVFAVGGRNGNVKSEDGVLDLSLAMPKELGGKGGATNPEQLFAAGYAACFENAVIHVSRNEEARIRDKDIEVIGTVSLSPSATGGFGLSVALDVTIAGVDQETAQTIVDAAHKACPYSNAIRGNVDVAITVAVK